VYCLEMKMSKPHKPSDIEQCSSSSLGPEAYAPEHMPRMHRSL
jgi:hypothetical protein